MLLKDLDHIYHRFIPETLVEGKRLGRHISWDPERLNKSVEPYLPANAALKSQQWARGCGIFDQGQLGSCTGNASIGMAGTAPFYVVNSAKPLDEAQSVTDYEYETTIDGLGQPYPPNDRGSSGDAAIKALIHFGYANAEYYALDFNTSLLTVANYGPTIWGINWYDSFDNPTSAGLITIAQGATVRGGHEVENVGIDITNNLLKFANSWGTGWGDQGYFYISFADAETLFSEEGTVGTIGVASVVTS